MPIVENPLKSRLTADFGLDYPATTLSDIDPAATNDQLFMLAEAIAIIRGNTLDDVQVEIEFELEDEEV